MYSSGLLQRASRTSWNWLHGVRRPLSRSTLRLLHFDQTVSNVPVLGGKAVVELTAAHGLVGIDATIADAPGVSPIASIGPAEAIAAVAKSAGVSVSTLGSPAAPTLYYYRDSSKDIWHLVYEVRAIPVAPPEFQRDVASERGHGTGPSPRHDMITLTYLVDAHDGNVVIDYSDAAWLDIPVVCSGEDEFGSKVTFYGFDGGGAIQMRDPLRNIRTFDLGFADLRTAAPPMSPVTNATFDFAAANTAAVSAHVNAMRVFDFYNDVLKRDGVDDKGMELISNVNCTYKPSAGSRDWGNAVWYNKQMWYGQVTGTSGKFESYSRYLDVIAHELTHGVTETTAGLKYLNESGALNESMSDIFGIIVKNLNGDHPDDVALWNWELGTGLGGGGRPLRNLADPASLTYADPNTGTNLPYPDRWSQYVPLLSWQDSGGVHINSNIHNKAAYNVLNGRDASGALVFDPKDAALYFYLALTRLSVFATFKDMLTTLQNVLRGVWLGRPAEIARRVNAVTEAYRLAGIV